MSGTQRAYLVLRSRASHAAFSGFCAVHRASCDLVAARGAHQLEVLEPGSRAMHTWISRWPSMTAAREGFRALDLSALQLPEPPLVLLAAAVPDDGLPPELDFVPTHRNVVVGRSQPPTLMLIEGTATDQERMDRYRDIILPLMREQDAFYLSFELGGAVEVLSGAWNEAIFAISRWPQAHAARAFWLGRRYQEDAIPLRLDVGTFQVVTLEGESDDFGGA
jgi:uncharacterized protein (DUF1330 family)